MSPCGRAPTLSGPGTSWARTGRTARSASSSDGLSTAPPTPPAPSLADVRVAAGADLAHGWLADPKSASFTIAVRFGDVSEDGAIHGGTWRLIESAIPGTATADQFDARARTITERILGAGAWTDTLWTAAYRKHERRVSNYRAGRVVLTGDAAHLNSPAGGQGLNTGLQDVHALAWRLAGALDGSGDADVLLDSYSQERSVAFDTDVRPLTDGIERMETLPARLRSIGFSAVGLLGRTALARLVARKLSMLSPTPARSAILDTRPPTGQRLPNVELSGGGRLYDRFGSAGLLLVHDGLVPNDLPPELRVEPMPARLPTLFKGSATLLVRPDHLVALATEQPASIDSITASLGRRPIVPGRPSKPANQRS